MYAINYAATALVFKRRYATVPLVLLLFAVQFVEVLWVLFNYVGIEHTALVGGVTRLTDMPWSHSVAMMLIYAIAAWVVLALVYSDTMTRHGNWVLPLLLAYVGLELFPRWRPWCWGGMVLILIAWIAAGRVDESDEKAE